LSSGYCGGSARLLSAEFFDFPVAGVHWDNAKERYPVPIFVNKAFTDIIEVLPSEIIGTPLRNYVGGYDSLSYVAGVVEDFNFHSLERKAVPIFIKYKDKTTYHDLVYIRVEEGKMEGVVKLLRQAWTQAYPDEFFTYNLAYVNFVNNNSKIFEMSHLLQMYSIISILLICFGLFGITFYAVNQRTKEIGIRKINGAKTYQILWLLLKPIFGWIIIGFAIGVPLAWWLMERWLQQFAYRVDVSIGSFFLALLLVSVITILTVLWQLWRTIKVNPVESLKSE